MQDEPSIEQLMEAKQVLDDQPVPHLEPEVNFVAGHTTKGDYRYTGQHIMLTVGTETFNVGFRATRMKYISRSKYMPHQGAAECARRRAS